MISMHVLYTMFIILQIIFGLGIVYLTLAFVTGAPFVPSYMHRARRMVELANLTKGSTIYDLGSGDGRILFLAAEKGAHAVGVEINPFLVYFTWVRSFFTPYRKHIHVRCKTLWSTDLSEADVVFIYLLPWRMDQLAIKLKKELKKGSLVVSNSFIFPNWPIYKQDPSAHVYVFRV